MKRTVGLVALQALLLTVVGCTAAVLNIKDAPIAANHTQEEVRQAIIAGGAARGWVVKDAGPGLMRASLHVRTHSAEIEIPYSSTGYSIAYVSSTDLDYKDGQIHRNYNRWIANLSQSIQGILNGAG